MRTTNRVHIVLFHQHQISTHVINADGLTFHRVMVMAIDTTNHDLLAIDEELISLCSNCAKARENRNNLCYFSIRIYQLHNDAITIGLFC